MAHHQKSDAIDILCKIRGDKDASDPAIVKEVELIDAVVEASYHKRNNYINIALGGRYSGKLHLGRRAVLGFALQQIQQWTGILVMVSWATKLFELAGFDAYKASWMSGLLNTFGVIGTAAAAPVIDRIGRRMSLQISFMIQGISLFLVAALIKMSQDRVTSNPRSLRLLERLRLHSPSLSSSSLPCSTLSHVGYTVRRSGHKKSVQRVTLSLSWGGRSVVA